MVFIQLLLLCCCSDFCLLCSSAKLIKVLEPERLCKGVASWISASEHIFLELGQRIYYKTFGIKTSSYKGKNPTLFIKTFLPQTFKRRPGPQFLFDFSLGSRILSSFFVSARNWIENKSLTENAFQNIILKTEANNF